MRFEMPITWMNVLQDDVIAPRFDWPKVFIYLFMYSDHMFKSINTQVTYSWHEVTGQPRACAAKRYREKLKQNISIVQLDSHVTSKNSYISTIKYLDKSILDTRDLKTLIEEARLTESGNSFQQLILRTKK